MTEEPKKHKYSRLYANVLQLRLADPQALKSIFIDLVQNHHAHYVSTSESLYNGWSHETFLRFYADGQQSYGILVDLDYPRSSDPPLLLAAGKSDARYNSSCPEFLDFIGGRIVGNSSDTSSPEVFRYGAELQFLISIMSFTLVSFVTKSSIASTISFGTSMDSNHNFRACQHGFGLCGD
ncbi:hypothetical protein MVEN_00271900 [Mycena venus]|uniref:Uncharacterized protein n=1 Tax=Mycena venus TaxID=2733690 RepID=A0A8H6Z3Z1_9AGAR|nr:hypothetical protein MVEN_00271900 [Mycena venus]